MTEDLQKVISFLESIGLQVVPKPQAAGFLGAVEIEGGIITYDPKNVHPGDVLHEAGHVAVTPSMFRPHLQNDTNKLSPLYKKWFEEHPEAFGVTEDPIGRAIMQASEVEATAWSYAAALKAGINTLIPFKDFFNGEGEDIHDMLSMGRYYGIHGLHHGGMTLMPNIIRNPEECFPHMLRWLQI